MGRHGPGPVYVGNADRRWWLALNPRKNQDKAKKQQVKTQGRKNSVKSRSGGGWFGGDKKKDDGKKKSGWW